MRIAITGASGNVGTALLRRLHRARSDGHGELEVVGLSRRAPDPSQAPYAGVRWHEADVGQPGGTELERAFAGADAVVHLAWQIQPNHDLADLFRTNVTGTANVLDAAGNAGVGHVVCASSVGAYSPADKGVRTNEAWPAEGIQDAHYSRHKAEQERLLDRFAGANPAVTVSRLRPGLIFQADAGAEIGRYFLGPYIPKALARLPFLPLVPIPPEIVFQAVHADDVADVYWRVLNSGAGGAFNIAAEPVITPEILAGVLRARRLFPLPLAVLRAGAAALWRPRLLAADSGWVNMAAGAPVMDTSRAREVLGWAPQRTSLDAIAEVLDALAAGSGIPASPVLRPRRRLLSG
jgi:nucleoside-diphosphate-sugar epimerase